MRVGIVTPVLTLLPRAHAPWEERASFDDVVTVARAADRLGFDHLTCSEHVAIPADMADVRGGRYFDPLSVFGHLSAVTERIRLATYVLVLGYHHPLEIVKRYGTLDVVSGGGRLVLGVGVGSLRQEFDLLGRPFDGRGRRADDALRHLRAAFGRRRPTAYEPFVVDPAGARDDIEMWVGGRTRRSLRRAVELADGWAPFGVSPDEVTEWLRWADDTIGTRPEGFEVVLQPARLLDPVADPGGAAAALDDLRAAGATMATVRFRSESVGHYLEQLDALAQVDRHPGANPPA